MNLDDWGGEPHGEGDGGGGNGCRRDGSGGLSLRKGFMSREEIEGS